MAESIDPMLWSAVMDPRSFRPFSTFRMVDIAPVQMPMSETQAFYRLAYNKEASDCAVRALAVACAAPYDEAHTALKNVGRLDGGPADVKMMIYAARQLHCHMVEFKPHGKTLRTAERILKDSKGGYILTTTNHAVGLWDGELIDFARGTLARVKHAFVIIRSKDK